MPLEGIQWSHNLQGSYGIIMLTKLSIDNQDSW